MKFLKSLYFHEKFYTFLTAIAVVFVISFWISWLFTIAWLLVLILVALFIVDLLLLYRTKIGVTGVRVLPLKLSNSDKNPIYITIDNKYAFKIHIKVIDELPIQFQKRDFEKKAIIKAKDTFEFKYHVLPVERGMYFFGKLNMYVSTMFRVISRRYSFLENEMVPVYPSYIQMNKYEFMAMSNNLSEFGLKKIRRIGHTLEFEQIKNYIVGDDVRTVNWKATAKHSKLMVNQYQDEKSQPIYSIIDLGRMMKMPFENLKLLDYAINSTLAFANIALKKNDKAGLITFAKKVDKIIPASNHKTHLNKINEALYSITTNFTDSDFGMLYATIKRKVKQRSLLILYTNFEHISSLKRELSFFKAISKKHLLIVVFFENTELNNLVNENSENLQAIYEKAIAEKFEYEKRLMVKELENQGVYVILTAPKNLTVNVINKYLQFKAKGLI